MHDAKYHESRANWRRLLAGAANDAATRARHLDRADRHSEKAWAIYFLDPPGVVIDR